MNLYRAVKIDGLELEGNLFLAPVAGYTNRGFRSLCAEQGANFSFTELVSAESLYRNPGAYGLGAESNDNAKLRATSACLIRRAENEARYAVQLFSGDPDALYKAALALAPLRPEALDINAGCPVPKVVKNGAGSALMKDPALLGRIVQAAVRASREALGGAPVTIKIRSGWDSASINYALCARVAVEAGAAMISLHPRTRAQGYAGKSDWTHIADLASRISAPVAGSGDLFAPEDAARMLAETGCAAVMFARGAMGNPFIFRETRALLETGSFAPASLGEKLRAALRHVELLCADIGERAACLEMRGQFCAYLKGAQGAAAMREKATKALAIADYQAVAEMAIDLGQTNP
ncbi:MAG: tRNA dihydrouridine synthase DusB [Treponema sp.]|nr:tRNA dihydrouridine synthase DusB [Treponema sp.]